MNKPNTVPKANPTDIAVSLRLMTGRLHRRLRQNTEVPISPTALSALGAVAAAGRLTVGHLADRERVKPPTMTSMIGRLESRGLVEREGDATDHRLTWVRATSAGKDLLLASRTQKNLYLERLLSRLDGPELAAAQIAVAAIGRLLELED
ncbi:MAG: MarR family winged helix-turn-helix transcriptional regulator [Candidatus Dormibacteraceae bacterium]